MHKAASRLPQSRRLRLEVHWLRVSDSCRLKIAAVAATAAFASAPQTPCWWPASRLPQSRRLRRNGWNPTRPFNYPPQDCRSRGDCGKWGVTRIVPHNPASRLPQSRRLRLPMGMPRNMPPTPPQDCRSRGDCGVKIIPKLECRNDRLKIAAVAATAAVENAAPGATSSTASRLPQSRRLRRKPCDYEKHGNSPPQDCRSRGDCGIACPPRVVGLSTASRLPQSRRLRPMPSKSTWQHGYPPQDCRSRGDCGTGQQERSRVGEDPPQDCRSRGDCGLKIVVVGHVTATPPQDCRSRGDCGGQYLTMSFFWMIRLKIAAVAATAAAWAPTCKIATRSASRLPQSRRLRLEYTNAVTGLQPRLKIAAVAATAATRGKPVSYSRTGRLKIAAVAATAASAGVVPVHRRPEPPQDCRSRGDCGLRDRHAVSCIRSASRLPQSRRLRPEDAPALFKASEPPQDCRSRGDCGFAIRRTFTQSGFRLKIAAVAATAAGNRSRQSFIVTTASRLPQSRRLRLPFADEP